MCGIAYQHNFDGSPVNNAIMQQFDKQRSRGVQGFGLYDGQFMHMVRATKEDKILKWLVKYDSNLLMFHHRNPTSTINVKRAAHPFSTKDYFGDNQYIMVHNGVISNADELFVKHQELGIEYQSLLEDLTFNDSEALLWDLALTLEGKQDKLQARGMIAFVAIKTKDMALDKLYFARNTSPLNMARDGNSISLSSEGEGESIDTDELYTFNYELKRLTHKPFEVPRYATTSYVSSYTGGYDPDERPNYNWQPNACNPENRYDNGYYDYDRDGNPMFTGLDDDDFETYEPTASQVEARTLSYVLKANGNLDMAYWQAETDYDDAEEWASYNNSGYAEVLLLEGVLDLIGNDPEYVDEHSISSSLGAICLS